MAAVMIRVRLGDRDVSFTAAGPTRVEYLAWSDVNPSPAANAFLGVLHRNVAAASP